MIQALTGTVVGSGKTSIFLATGAIEWELEVSERSMRFFLAQKENPVRLFTYLYIRTEFMQLYGFESESERETFLQLITVNTIGPRVAMKILSKFSPDEVWKSIGHEEIGQLALVQGVSKKGAEKIIITLKDKAALQQYEQQTPQHTREKDFLAALQDMGYDKHLATVALHKYLDNDNDAEVLRLTIAKLSEKRKS